MMAVSLTIPSPIGPYHSAIVLRGAFAVSHSQSTVLVVSGIQPGVRELVNLQNVRGKAKAYQVRQLLRLIERYNLSSGKP
jgi:hypothetical protein